ncbi:MAG: class I tRNA ligase family protein, partial [Candidatus Caenarcaniphilales bacterium]|nr:class I tRNA ligase family protein [Candidatus Caenarcaniphilales bacterium]
MNFYKPVSNRPDFNTIEQEIIKFWKGKNVFKKSIELRAEAEEFIFYEGPPTANGRPGVHHVLARTFKDLVCRYQTMKGKKVKRQAGWDEHGLPVEIEVQKTNDLKSKDDIEQMGIGKFNELCAQSTQKYIEEWEQLTERMAYWVDFADAYRTSDPKYIERVWGILKQLFDAGLLYKGFKIVPWACDSGTVVSQAEVALGYKDVIDETAYVKFQLTDESAKKILKQVQDDRNISLEEAPVYMLAWTTTPWTLPSNMALAVGPDIEYVVCRRKPLILSLSPTGGEGLGVRSEYIVLSKKRWKAVLGESEWELVGGLKGSQILYSDLPNNIEVSPHPSFGDRFIMTNKESVSNSAPLQVSYFPEGTPQCINEENNKYRLAKEFFQGISFISKNIQFQNDSKNSPKEVESKTFFLTSENNRLIHFAAEFPMKEGKP